MGWKRDQKERKEYPRRNGYSQQRTVKFGEKREDIDTVLEVTTRDKQVQGQE